MVIWTTAIYLALFLSVFFSKNDVKATGENSNIKRKSSYLPEEESRLSHLLREYKDLKSKNKKSQPHIVYVKADDMGWNDIGWNNPKIQTPNLMDLAEKGVILDRFYAQPSCTPSRVAFNTGLYPFKLGFQANPLDISDPVGLPFDLKIIPEKMKELGYDTHLIGKWHLGYCNLNMTAFERGYDSFYGINLALGDYVTKTGVGLIEGKLVTGFDFRDNTGVSQDVTTHQSLLFRERMVRIIERHDPDTPLFLHHTAKLPHDPLQVPPGYEALFPEIANEARRTFTTMVFLLDETVGAIVDALKQRGMWEDTIFLFTSDNGANPDDFHAGNNFPLRGSKGAYYEGGTRVPAMVHGKGIKKTGYRSQELFHISDFHNTFINVAGGEVDNSLDSLNVWDSLAKGGKSPRKEIVYNINSGEESPGAAIRVGEYKLIIGSPEINFLGAFNRTIIYPELVNANDSIRLQNCGIPCVGSLDVLELYNVEVDPSENNNIAFENEVKVLELLIRIDELRQSEVLPITGVVSDPASNPDNFGGVVSSGWC